MNCSRCDFRIPLGKAKCTSCGHWNNGSDPSCPDDESILLSEVKSAEDNRIKTGDWDYCWGGGLVRTSVSLVGGLPGAGKSTMLLQLLAAIHQTYPERESMYIATEEALPEIKLRADRLNIRAPIRMVPAMSGVANIGIILETRKPIAIILDSLQGMIGVDDNAGTELLSTLKKFATTLEAPVIVISHVNKSGDYAGLMTFQHAVDALLTLSPEDDGLRVLEVLKNRNGRAFIESKFEMTEHGLILVLNDDEDENNDENDENDENN
jgi:DNA repair protein RadA/Sms